MEAVPPLGVLSIKGKEGKQPQHNFEHPEHKGDQEYNKTENALEAFDHSSFYLFLLVHSVNGLVEDVAGTLPHPWQDF